MSGISQGGNLNLLDVALNFATNAYTNRPGSDLLSNATPATRLDR